MGARIRIEHPEVIGLLIKPQTAGRFQQMQERHRSGEDTQV